MTTTPASEPIGGQSTLNYTTDAPGMDATIKTEWLDDLRSGNFHQGEGKLHTSTRNEDGTERHEFCCLGVLCERAVAAGIVERVDVSDDYAAGEDHKVYAYAPTEGPNAGVPYPHYPPPAVAVWAGLPSGDTNPYVDTETGRRVIANVNDEGATFTDLADMIENQF